MTTKFITAKQDNVSTPLPLEKEKFASDKSYRVWIGNVDPLVTEFKLLQLLQSYGRIKEFDFLFHKIGPLQGKSRGFHFATYYSKTEAQMAIKCLNGKKVLSKQLIVRWADQSENNEKSLPVNINLKSDLVKDNLPSSENQTRKISKKSMIHSIEEKLKQMERSNENSTTSSHGLHPLLQKAKANEAAEEARKRMHPYQKPYRKKR